MKQYEKVPRTSVLAVNEKELTDAFSEIKADWENHLQNTEIKLPKKQTAKWYQLAILKHFEGSAVHKDDISAKIAKITRKPASDQQVRHLKTQYGWYILNKDDAHMNKHTPAGCHVLITTKRSNPSSILHRKNVLSNDDWQEILKQYGNKCASCGSAIGEYHRFDSSYKITTLERGHMNPNKPLETGNIIPQCRWCNRVARSDFVFDEQGRPTAIANQRPVARADTEVVDKIWKWLKKKYNN